MIQDAFGTLVRIGVPSVAGEGARKLLKLLRFYIAAVRWTMKARSLKKSGFRFIIVNDIYLLPLGVLVSRASGLPFIYDAHEEFAAMEAARYPPKVLRIVEALESRLAGLAAMVWVAGRSRVSRWSAAGIQPVVIPNLGRHVDDVRADPVEPSDAVAEWDIVYCGTLTEQRRLDLLVELAQMRPDIKIAVAGAGRAAAGLIDASGALDNFEFLGWQEEPDRILRAARSIYYGLDPEHPYAAKACPNNLYQALWADRPLVFMCGGEPADVLSRHAIGFRVEASAASLAAAIDDLAHAQFDFASARAELIAESREAQRLVSLSIEDLRHEV